MTRSSSQIAVYLERGAKRTFAGAIDWPGWCRSGRDETSALQALLDAAPRYRRALARSRIRFVAPRDVSAVRVATRLPGNATTDFGAPGVPPPADLRPLEAADVRALARILEACWQEFDAAIGSARGRELRKGPRGGGRDVDAIVRHIVEADDGYLMALGWKHKPRTGDIRAHLEDTRRAMLEGIAASARGEIPERGPRGGVRWKPRFIVRRSAWHQLDHAWEIEDRMMPAASTLGE